MNKKEKLAKVFHFDLYGKRDKKYDVLRSKSIKNIGWSELDCKEPQYFFVKKDFRLEEEYSMGVRMDELFGVGGSGIKFRKDNLLVKSNFFPEDVKRMVESMRHDSNEEIKRKYSLSETSDWKIDDQRMNFGEDIESNTYKVQYRPFDYRYTYYPINTISKIIPRGDSRMSLFKNFFTSENYGIISKRGIPYNTLCFATRVFSDMRTWSNPGTQGSEYIFPLYLYTDTQFDSSARQPNITPRIIDEIAKKLTLEFIPDHEHADSGKKSTFNPLDILDYIYAILHSPTYRERYKEFLKIDFPRIPFTSDQKLFWALVEKGREIREYHLIEHANSNSLITEYPVAGENEIINPKYSENKVWINNTQYFDKVPQVAWEFYIGGYQPAQKWLKDRKGRKLSFDEVLHYQKIIVALVNTDRVMKEIDKLIPKWPIK